MGQEDDSASSLSEEEVEDSHHIKDGQNSWEEDSSSDSSDANDGEEVEIADSDNQQSLEQQKILQKVGSPEQEKSENSSSGSSSGSSSSDGSESDSDNPQAEDDKRKPKKDDKKIWEENPDVYGIRRSNRARKEPQRLVIQSGSDSDDSGKKKRKGRRKNESWIPTLSGSESEESDSSFDVPQKVTQKRSKPTSGSQKRRKQQRGRTLSTSSDEYGKKRRGKKKSHYVGGARRNTSNKVSYKEDSEDETDSDDLVEYDEKQTDVPTEPVETIEKVMRHRKGRPEEIGAQTTIYSPENEEFANKGEPDLETETVELQFLIKWKTWSHLHNTWETKKSLTEQKCGGFKKLENYIKRMDEIENWKKISSPEDVEYFECQSEMNEDIQKQYQKVERIISHQFMPESDSSYPDYLCKWQGLPYSDCTWEDGNLTARFFQSYIDEYLERERSDTIPNKNAKCLRHRPKFVPLKEQPDYIGNSDLQLRDYQLDGVNWLAHAWSRELSVILSDEMGLGKTIQTISFLSYLFHTHSLYGPFLVVVPLSTMDAWQREFQLWGPDMNLIVYIGDVNSRTNIQEYEWCFKKNRKLKFNVLLTTYEMLLRDKELLGSLYWAALLVDEAHRLKNDDSLLYRVVIEFRTNFRLLITGTPLQNSLKELWSLMHFIMPKRFDEWSNFESEYSVSDKEGLQKLHRDLEPYLLRRVKKDVEKSLPAKVEQILRMEMSQVQKQYYKLILTKNVQELCRELKGSFSGLLNIIVELKKCCNHSNLIKPLDFMNEDPNLLQTLIKGSGKMILLDKLLCRLKETGHRVLIFSQMVRMLDIIADYLYMKRFMFQRLDGSIRGEQRRRALDHFNAEGSQDFCFLLSTRAGGLGINLASADTVIIFDSDWNPQNDLQAMARAHRIGQKNQVNIYRFVTKNTIEEDIIERAKKKMVLDHLIIQRMDTTGRRILSKSNTAPSSNAPFNKEELSSILKFGAEDLFKDADQDQDQKLHAMDIDEILQRAETQEHQDNLPSVGEELLSQFKVVNYAAFNEEEIKPTPTANPMQKLWEEIIPEEERKKAEEEREKEKKAELTLKPRSRKTVEKMNIGQTSNNKKVKSKAIVDTDTSSDSDDDSVEENDVDETKGKKATKRQTKSKPVKKEGVKGFSDVEIRRFIKSYKKFARPMTRLDSIAEDAELTDKSVNELKELGELLKSSCEQAVKDYQEKLLQDEQFDGKKKGASLKISGVTINAPSVLKAEVDLEPLALCLPQETQQQKGYRLTHPTRSVHWGISWGVVEDSMLLIGMLKYGVGNWDAIKNDHALGLSGKILPMGNGKPQNKHLQSRADYLLKLLKEQKNHHEPEQKKKKIKVRSHKQEDYVSPHHSESEHTISNTPNEQKASKKKKTKKTVEKKNTKRLKEEKTRDERISSPAVPEENPVVVMDFREEMAEETFKKCKEKMRPEKKSLQQLDSPDQKSTPKEQVQTTKKCLLNIGDHIERCLDEYTKEPKELDVWRSNLWSFVAKFTELGPAKLHKLYRAASRKRDVQRDEQKKEIQKLKTNYTQSLHEIGKHLPPDRLELEEARKKALGLNSNNPASAKIPKLNKIKIPHKKKGKDGTNNNNKNTVPNYKVHESRDEQPYRGRHGGEKMGENWRHRNKPYNRQKLTQDNESGNTVKTQTYREWKEAQKARLAAEEKSPLQENRQKTYKDKPYYGDEKPHNKEKHYGDEKAPFKHEQYTSYDPRSRPRYHRDSQEYSGEYSISPSYIKSPSASLSPHSYADSWSRKRTSSNNIEFVATKKLHRDPESSNSNQSWTTGGNT